MKSSLTGRGGLKATLATELARHLGRATPGVFGRQLERPCFMVGCGRSGTTLLAGILSRHRSVAVFPGEANDLWHAGLYPWHESTEDVAPIWVDPREFSRRSLERLDWNRLRGVFGAFQFLMRRPVFVNKSVMLSFILGDIARQFEEARFIHLVRDGRAVALSYAKKNLTKVRDNAQVYASAGVSPDFESLVLQSFQHWMDHIQAIEQADREQGLSASGRLLELTYEELTEHPERALAVVLGFLGIAELPSESLLEPVDNRNRKFSVELSPRLRDELAAQGDAALRRRGYST